MKKYQNLFIFSCILSFTAFAYAQQVSHYTQYTYNMQVLNPAYVGLRADLSISLLSRQQWVGLEGAPATKTFSISSRTYRGLGLGLTVVNDNIGLAESTNVNIDASYTLIASDYARFAFGLKGGITFFNNNLFAGITPDNDTNVSTNGRFPNIGFGALYYTQDFFVGLSLPYMLKTPLFRAVNSSYESGLADDLNYFFSAGALFELSDAVLFKPSTVVKYASSLPVSIDVNANFLYKNSIEAGVSYRYQNAVSGLVAFIINEKFRIGYAYDHQLINYGANINTHEILLHIDFSLKRNNRWLLHNKCFF